MLTKEEFKIAGISENCFNGLRDIASWCERYKYITPTQYSRRRHMYGRAQFTAPMIAGGILAKWVNSGVLYRFPLQRNPHYPEKMAYGYALTERGIQALFFLETSPNFIEDQTQ